MHLIIDGYGGAFEKLADENLIRTFLEECPAEIKMRKIGSPSVYRYNSGSPDDSGYSGIVLIAESHITVHTFPLRGLLWGDIFSCKEFDTALVEQKLKTMFHLEDAKLLPLERGLEQQADRLGSTQLEAKTPIQRKVASGESMPMAAQSGEVQTETKL